MDDRRKASALEYDRRLPCYAVAGACAVLLPIIYDFNNIVAILYALFAAPIVCVALLILALRKRGLRWISITSTLGIFAAVSWVLVAYDSDLHRTLRWSLEGQRYKIQVRETPTRQSGDLRHVEWDGWGFLGMDNSVYLVFDPNDTLLKASQQHSSGEFPGIPCKVPDVKRLERHYYSVLFYTNTSWDSCTF